MNLRFPRTARTLLCALAAAAALAGCGGGGPATPAASLSGVAAVGDPIVGGSVSVQCAGGSALNATTSATGAWQVSFSGQTLPCAVQVTGGSVGGSANGTNYHSVALSLGTVNITPLTNLVMAQLLGASPSTWFAAPTFGAINTTALQTALNTVATNLGLSTTLGSLNPLTSPFVAQSGNTLDDILEAMKAALLNLSQTYAALLAAAQGGNYTPFTGFGTAFSTAYANLGGSTPGGSGSLTVAIAIGGVPSTSVVINNVPVPTSQTAFCTDIQSDSSLTSLTAGGGSLTINSCSFSNNVGRIDATLNTTVPFPLALNYVVTYTYAP